MADSPQTHINDLVREPEPPPALPPREIRKVPLWLAFCQQCPWEQRVELPEAGERLTMLKDRVIRMHALESKACAYRHGFVFLTVKPEPEL